MSDSPTTLRPALLADVPAIEALVTDAFGQKPEPMLTDYCHAVQEHQVWLLDKDGLSKAILELSPCASYLLVATLAVSPGQQRSGLGHWLMAFAEEEARRQDYHEMRLYTNERLSENLSFYARLGYRESHREALAGGTSLVHMVKSLER